MPPSVVSGPGPHLTQLGRVTVLAIAAAALIGLDLPPALFAALGIAAIGDMIMATVWFRPVEMSAAIPPITEDGTAVRSVLRHPGLRDDVILTIDNDAHPVPRSAGSDGHTAVSVEAPHRGIYGALGVRGVLVGPLGLACCTRRWLILLPGLHVVVPRRLAVDDHLATARRRVDEHDSSRTDAAEQLREYQPGDPVRNVHWAASERHGELVVRSGQAPRPRIHMAVSLGSSNGVVAEAVASRAMDVGCRYLEAGCELVIELVVARREESDPAATPSRPSPYRSPPHSSAPGSQRTRASGSATDRASLGVLLAHAVAARVPAENESGTAWPGALAGGAYDVIVEPTGAEARAQVSNGADWAPGLGRPSVRGKRST